MKRFAAISFGFMFLLAIGLSSAAADTYEYTFSATGSGCFGGGGSAPGGNGLSCPGSTPGEVDFTNQLYTLTLTSDSADIATISGPNAGTAASVLTAMFTVDGNTYTLLDTYYLLDTESTDTLSWGFGDNSMFISEYLFVSNPAFSTYQLGALGTLSGLSPGLEMSSAAADGWGPFACPSTPNGVCTDSPESFLLTGSQPITFSAQDISHVIPEPATLALFGSGLIAVARKAFKKS